MAIYSLHHSAIGKSTQAHPHTAAAHVRYITRPAALTRLDAARFPAQPTEAAGQLEVLENGDRRNARVIDKVRLALPRELSPEQRAQLVREYAEDVTRGRASWLAAFHEQGKDAQNPHCHLVIRDRDPDTRRLVIGMSERGSTALLREKWEQHCNAALAAAGRAERVDRRTLAAQGIDRPPTIHEGPRGQAAQARGRTPQSKAINARNGIGSRSRCRTVNYPVIDDGRSRSAYNAALRNSHASRDYWAAIDADNLRREFAGMGLSGDTARMLRLEGDPMNAGRAAPHPVTEEERQRREQAARPPQAAQPKREPEARKGLFGWLKERVVEPAKQKAGQLRYASRQFFNDPTKDVKQGLDAPHTVPGLLSSKDAGKPYPRSSRPQTAEEQQSMGLGEAAYKRGIRPMFTGQPHPTQDLPSNRESDYHHLRQDRRADREAEKGNPQFQPDYADRNPFWSKSQLERDRETAKQSEPVKAAQSQDQVKASDGANRDQEPSQKLAVQQPPAKAAAQTSPEQDRRADQIRDRMQQQRAQEKKRGLER